MFCIMTVYCCLCLVILQLVGRLSQDELVTQLPSFLPTVFYAFSNQSPDVRKVLTHSSDIVCFS
jgi:CLIP-associating protein 1/2